VNSCKGLAMRAMKQIDQLMQKAVLDSVFPGGVLLVSKNNAVIILKAYGYANIFTGLEMTVDTIFDLASLTKPLATTPAIMKLIQQGKLELEQTLKSIIPEFNKTDKGDVSIRQLLRHNSGLPDYVPYYKALSRAPFEKRKSVLRTFLLKEPVRSPIGQAVLYSDLGFMILNWVVERVSGLRLDRFVAQQVYNPLGLDCENGLFFVDIKSGSIKKKFAATEFCPWRNRLLNGVVHDENAYAVGGIEGHAGLFGNARNVHDLLSKLVSVYHGNENAAIFTREMVQTFLKPRDRAGRALGFDTPDLKDSSAGKYFSADSIGHLGFTGTSFWIDLPRSIIVILLTNRIHPSRENSTIKAFRPIIHNAVMEALLYPNAA